MLSPGMFIQNRYEVISKIGSGGTADVYKAKDHKLNRFVAVKVLKKELREDKVFVSKFRVEAQSAAGLAHGNIVNVYDVGEEAGINYIVMELIEGITLKEYIADKGRLTAREATSIALQISAGLEAAHNNGIIHRDVKPQNIIISTDGKVKVADFGIARAATANTITSNVMGSVHYSSPEQTRGGYSDAKSDIYSLGITLYEMLTGHVPFDGDTAVAIALKHLQEEMKGPKEVVPEVPYSMSQIVRKCTQKSTERRYSNMAELIRDLRESLVNPDGDFVTFSVADRTSKTIVMSRDEVDKIKQEQRRPAYDESLDTGAASGLFVQENESVQNRAYESGSYYQKSQFRNSQGRGEYDPDRWNSGYSENTYFDESSYHPYHEPMEEVAEAGEKEPAPSDRIKKKRRKIARDEDSDLSPQLERAVTIGGTVIAIVVALLFLVLLAKAFGIIRFGSSKSDSGSDEVVVTTDTEKQTDAAQDDVVVIDTTLAGAETTTEKATEAAVVVGFALSDLSGMEQSQALALLVAKGLQYAVNDSQYSDTVAAGYVISTSPAAGETVYEGDLITVYVSLGQEETTAPENVVYVTLWDLTGYTVERAEEALDMMGLVAAYDYEASSDISEGMVTRSSAEDTDGVVAQGSTVTLFISTGPAATTAEDTAEEEVVVVEDTTASESTSATSSYQCNASLAQPSGYTGQPVRITLVQNNVETTVYEGEVSFPYLLQVYGEEGVETGTAYVYLLDADTGETLSKIEYSGIVFSKVS